MDMYACRVCEHVQYTGACAFTCMHISRGPAIARQTSTFELAGNHTLSLAAAPAALAHNLPSTESLDSYDSAVEDAQRRVPKLECTMNTPKKLPATAARADESPKPHGSSPEMSPLPPVPAPGRTRSGSLPSPGPSASEMPPPLVPKSKRSKSPSYWRT